MIELNKIPAQSSFLKAEQTQVSAFPHGEVAPGPD